jgi:hypothetical protein
MLFSLTACYSTRYVPRGDGVQEAFKKSEEVYLNSLDKTYYFDEPSWVKFESDSLYGTARIMIEDKPGPIEDVKMAVRDIYSLRVKSFDATKTAVLLGAGALAVVYISDASNSWKSSSSSSFHLNLK